MEHIGYLIKKINKELECSKNGNLKGYDITAQQFHIIMFISKNSDKNICQKDVEHELEIKGATVSGLLSRLENNGYLERVSDEADSRYKYLKLTDKALKFREEIFKSVDLFESKMLSGFSDEEVDLLRNYLHRIQDNILKEKYND